MEDWIEYDKDDKTTWPKRGDTIVIAYTDFDCYSKALQYDVAYVRRVEQGNITFVVHGERLQTANLYEFHAHKPIELFEKHDE